MYCHKQKSYASHRARTQWQTNAQSHVQFTKNHFFKIKIDRQSGRVSEREKAWNLCDRHFKLILTHRAKMHINHLPCVWCESLYLFRLSFSLFADEQNLMPQHMEFSKSKRGWERERKKRENRNEFQNHIKNSRLITDAPLWLFNSVSPSLSLAHSYRGRLTCISTRIHAQNRWNLNYSRCKEWAVSTKPTPPKCWWKCVFFFGVFVSVPLLLFMPVHLHCIDFQQCLHVYICTRCMLYTLW